MDLTRSEASSNRRRADWTRPVSTSVSSVSVSGRKRRRRAEYRRGFRACHCGAGEKAGGHLEQRGASRPQTRLSLRPRRSRETAGQAGGQAERGGAHATSWEPRRATPHFVHCREGTIIGASNLKLTMTTQAPNRVEGSQTAPCLPGARPRPWVPVSVKAIQFTPTAFGWGQMPRYFHRYSVSLALSSHASITIPMGHRC